MGIMDAGGAPGYMGPTPPDRNEMTLGDHLQAALQIMSSQPMDKQMMVQVKAFYIATNQIIQEKTGQQGQAQPGEEQEASQSAPPSNDTEDYGAGAGAPAAENEYGAQ